MATPSDEQIEEASRFFASGETRLDVAETCVSGNLAVLVAVERQHGVVGGSPDQDWSLRVTLVFRRSGDRWQLVHRHADALVREIPWDLFTRIARVTSGRRSSGIPLGSGRGCPDGTCAGARTRQRGVGNRVRRRPVARWLMPTSGRDRQMFRALAAHIHGAPGCTDIAVERAQPMGAALWDPPGHRLSVRQQLLGFSRLRVDAGDRMQRGGTTEADAALGALAWPHIVDAFGLT